MMSRRTRKCCVLRPRCFVNLIGWNFFGLKHPSIGNSLIIFLSQGDCVVVRSFNMRIPCAKLVSGTLMNARIDCGGHRCFKDSSDVCFLYKPYHWIKTYHLTPGSDGLSLLSAFQCHLLASS